MSKLTQTELKSLLCYDPVSGSFLRIKNSIRSDLIGKDAGHLSKDGYVIIKVNCIPYKAHRLAWLYMEGYFPEFDIDHINRNKSDNSWGNLRHVSHICNMHNQIRRGNNSSGVTGVGKERNQWRAYITIRGETNYLGTYNTILEAAKARFAGEQRLKPHACETNSSALAYITKNS